MRLMLLGLLIAACATHVQIAPTAKPAGVRHCFTVEIRRWWGRKFLSCADTAQLCAESLAAAQKYGSFAGVRQLGQCERVTVN